MVSADHTFLCAFPCTKVNSKRNKSSNVSNEQAVLASAGKTFIKNNGRAEE